MLNKYGAEAIYLVNCKDGLSLNNSSNIDAWVIMNTIGKKSLSSELRVEIKKIFTRMIFISISSSHLLLFNNRLTV